MIKELIDAVVSEGFAIVYRKTRLADAYVDYDKKEIVIGKKKDICLLHECIHVLYDEILCERLSEKNVEKSAKRILHFSSM